MSPTDQKGRHYEDEEARSDAAVASAARTTTGIGSSFNSESATALEATLSVTAASGTSPTLDVRLETSIDAGTTWSTVDSFGQKTAAATEGKVFGPIGDVCRWAWTIGGTSPSFTFSISAQAQREH